MSRRQGKNIQNQTRAADIFYVVSIIARLVCFKLVLNIIKRMCHIICNCRTGESRTRHLYYKLREFRVFIMLVIVLKCITLLKGMKSHILRTIKPKRQLFLSIAFMMCYQMTPKFNEQFH